MRRALLVGIMAILTFGDITPLQGFYAWARETGNPPAVPCPQGNILEILASRLTRGTYAESGDTIRYSAFLASGDAVINFGGQWANDEGVYKRYSHILQVSAASSPARAFGPASAGWYRDAAVSVETVGITGQTLYVTQELGRTNGGGFAPIAMLAQGYLTSVAPVSDKPNTPPTPGGGGGGGGGCCISTLGDGTFDPDIGAFTVVVPSGSMGRLIYANATYVASGSAGNRTVNIQLNPASGFGWTDTNQNIQTAGQTKGYVWQIGGPTMTDAATGDYYRPLPESLWFSGDFTVEIRANNPQVGDNWLHSDVTYEIKGP